MNNFILSNISYLINKSNLSQNDFGLLFDLKKGVIAQYLNERAIPKLETIDKICLHFEITIDQFVKTDLSKGYEKTKTEKEDGNTERLRKGIEVIEALEKELELTKKNNALLEENKRLIDRENARLTEELGLCIEEKKRETVTK